MEQQESDAGGWAWFLALASVVCVGILAGSFSCEQRKTTPPTEGQGSTEANAPKAPVLVSGPARRGQELFDTVGCRGCHKVYGAGGTIGPDLTGIADQGRSREWFRVQIRDPKAHMIHSVMFPFDYLSDQQVDDLVAYLETLTVSSAKPAASGTPNASASLSSSAKQGKQIFDTLGCLGCHTVHGRGGKIGPDLSDIANAGHSREWLRVQIRDPKTHDPQTAMPAWDNLPRQQVDDLIDYLESLKGSPTPGSAPGGQGSP